MESIIIFLIVSTLSFNIVDKKFGLSKGEKKLEKKLKDKYGDEHLFI